ncbi:MAG: hypothetical protein BIFFINMI_04051 [Phycisphaerae bacterium]|nr:hypothetical protein [Phycisphaerae bacterium]
MFAHRLPLTVALAGLTVGLWLACSAPHAARADANADPGRLVQQLQFAPNDRDRQQAADQLARAADDGTLEALHLAAVYDPSREVRNSARSAVLSILGQRRPTPPTPQITAASDPLDRLIAAMLGSADADARRLAARQIGRLTLGEASATRAVSPLEFAAVFDPDADSRDEARDAARDLHRQITRYADDRYRPYFPQAYPQQSATPTGQPGTVPPAQPQTGQVIINGQTYTPAEQPGVTFTPADPGVPGSYVAPTPTGPSPLVYPPGTSTSQADAYRYPVPLAANVSTGLATTGESNFVYLGAVPNYNYDYAAAQPYVCSPTPQAFTYAPRPTTYYVAPSCTPPAVTYGGYYGYSLYTPTRRTYTTYYSAPVVIRSTPAAIRRDDCRDNQPGVTVHLGNGRVGVAPLDRRPDGWHYDRPGATVRLNDRTIKPIDRRDDRHDSNRDGRGRDSGRDRSRR